MKLTLLNFCGIILLLLIIWLLFKYGIKQYKIFKEGFENKYELDKSEYPENVDFRITLFHTNPENVIYIFWSGGYSSTFRLCQLLLIEEKYVQPIYLNTNNFGNYTLKNKMEISRMKQIRNQLLKDYPILKTRLAPTKYVKFIKHDPIITNQFKYLHTEFFFFESNEKKDKYENIARFSRHHKHPIELPIDKDEYYLQKVIKPYLETSFENHKKLKIDIPPKYQNIHIFNNCRFPVLHLNKNNMKTISINNNFYYILKMSWSCNDPIENNIACLKCSNCIKRNI